MKWFVNLQTRNKLVWGFGLMIVLLAVVIAISYRGITTVQQSMQSLATEEFANVAELREVQYNQTEIRGMTLTTLLIADPAVHERSFKAGDERTVKNDELVQRLLQRERDPAHHAKLEEFDRLRKAFRETRANEVVPLIQSGKTEEARALATGIQADRNQRMRNIVEELVRGAESEAQKAVTRSEEIASESARILVVLGAMALLLAVTATFLLNRIIAAPLDEISRAAEQIVTGDLTVHIALDNRGDEVGVLAEAFRNMVKNLREVNTLEAGDAVESPSLPGFRMTVRELLQ